MSQCNALKCWTLCPISVDDPLYCPLAAHEQNLRDCVRLHQIEANQHAHVDDLSQGGGVPTPQIRLTRILPEIGWTNPSCLTQWSNGSATEVNRQDSLHWLGEVCCRQN